MLASSIVHLTDEPSEVLLKHSFTVHGVLLADGVQAGLGSVGLPTTVEQNDAILIDLSDLIAVEVDVAETIRVSTDLSVARLPVTRLTDGGVHQGFDLTHWFG